MQNIIQILGDLSGIETLGYFFMGIIIFTVISIVFLIITFIIIVISYWKLFEKASEEGWKALIPVYNVYTICQLVGINTYWLLIVISAVLLLKTPFLSFISALAIIYFNILISVSIAKSYGKEASYALGLLIFPAVFYPILSFGKAEYIGPNSMQDIFFQNDSRQSPNTTSAPNQQQSEKSNYCPYCGNKLDSKDLFCSNCGTKIN